MGVGGYILAGGGWWWIYFSWWLMVVGGGIVLSDPTINKYDLTLYLAHFLNKIIY